MESQSGHHPGHHGHSSYHPSTLRHSIHTGGGNDHHQINLDSSHPHQHPHHQAKHTSEKHHLEKHHQEKPATHHSSHHTGHHHHHHVSSSSLNIVFGGCDAINYGGGKMTLMLSDSIVYGCRRHLRNEYLNMFAKKVAEDEF